MQVELSAYTPHYPEEKKKSNNVHREEFVNFSLRWVNEVISIVPTTTLYNVEWNGDRGEMAQAMNAVLEAHEI